MIEINLLPQKLRKKRMEFPKISFLPIISSVVGIIVIVHLLLSLSVNMKAGELDSLKKKWQEILPDKEDADEVIRELTVMRSRIDAIDRLIEGRLRWAKKLSDLNDAIIPGVWLNRLWVEGKADPKAKGGAVKTLHLNGNVIVTGGEETAAVGKFMWSLKNHPGFFADFSEVESAYMQQSTVKDVEVMNFELICRFK